MSESLEIQVTIGIFSLLVTLINGAFRYMSHLEHKHAVDQARKAHDEIKKMVNGKGEENA